MLEYVENDVIEYIQRETHNGKDDIQGIITLFEDKGAYLSALLGEYSNNQFLERLKTSVKNHEEYHGIKLSENNPLLPYIKEFQFTASVSLFRLWQRRQKDITAEELINLLFRLNTGGISTFLDEE